MSERSAVTRVIMSDTRDPRLEPKIGDVLRRPNGVVITVVRVLKDKIEWTSREYHSRLIGQLIT